MKTQLLDLLAYSGVKILIAVLSRIPHRMGLEIGACFGRTMFYLSKRRRNAYADLKAAFGERYTERERKRIVREHYANLGRNVVEILRFPKLDKAFIEKNIHIDHFDRFYNLSQENHGIILLTAHFGNWELLQIVSGILGKPIYALARKQKLVRLDRLLNRLRESHGSVSIRRGMRVRDLIRALQRNELIGVLGDQDAGKHEGLILPILGRKTTIPTGSFELAQRTGSPILPCFIARQKGAKHRIYVGEPIRIPKSRTKTDFTPYVQDYIQKLEKYVYEYPSHWLWASKRWKYTWTKRIAILSDGKVGHVKQSEALGSYMRSLKTQYERPGMEYTTQRIQVEFKSSWHRKLFPWFAFFFIPWAQGRLQALSFFFKQESQKAIRECSADFIISTGSSLIPLNLCLAKENHGKSLVLMKPSFPFNFFRYDLAVIPHHDRGKMPKETFRTFVTPSHTDLENQQDGIEKIKRELLNANRAKVSLFLGGPTKQYRMDLAKLEKVVASLERLSRHVGDYLITTSRRTPDSISCFLKQKMDVMPACQKLVVATEDSRPEVVPAFMSIADVLIVTSDSVSMISEAVSSRKKVIVLRLGDEGLPEKHGRFQEALVDQSAVVTATPETLEDVIQSVGDQLNPDSVIQEEKDALCRRLQEIL